MVTIDKGLGEELDTAQAVFDGAIYCSVAFGTSALMCLFYWWWLPAAAWWYWPAAAVVCLVLSRLFYLLA